jgi:serine protease Do
MIRKATYISILVALVLSLGYTGALPRVVSGVTYAVESGKAKAAQEQLQNASWENAFELAAQAIQPSVVSITSVRTVRPTKMPFNRRGGGLNNDDFFERFFNDNTPQREFRQQGLGSGVIIDERGYILTNNHVVAQADKLTVHLSDNRELPAKLIGTDPRTDVAVIKIEANGLLAAKLGTSDNLKIGQWVMAIGSPFGLDQTVTSGIISAKGRANLGVTDLRPSIRVIPAGRW